jgi:hypothetical protein
MLAPGWVELYRDRRLVSYGPVSPTGAALDVPVSYRRTRSRW